LKRLLLLLGVLAFCLPAFGQGIRFGDQQPVQSVQTPGGPIYSVPNATINFCNSPANGTPCTNKVTTYTDITLTTACPTSTQVVLSATNTCVATTDQYGNWGVWIAPGVYTFTVQVAGGASLGPYTVTISGGGGSILPTINNWLALNNFTAGATVFGNPVAGFTGSWTIGHCPLVSAISPLTFIDGGSSCSGGGGSGTIVASPQYQIFAQPNPGSSATAQGLSTLTTDASGNLHAGASVSILGPRPYVDVTAYGADPTATSDSTAAFQSAITAACTPQSEVFVPPGKYKISQPQSSNAPILTPGTGCNNAGHGLIIRGAGSAGSAGSFVPQAEIIVTPGASPGLGPVLFAGASGASDGVGSLTLENLALYCYNQCFQELSGGDMWFVNDTMTVTASQTNCATAGCTTDTTPVALYGGLEFYFFGGTYINDNAPSGTNSSVAPSILLSTDSSNHSAGLLYVTKSVLFGPVADDALTSPSSGWGTVYLTDLIFEALGSQSPFLTQNLGANTTFGNLNLTNVIVADSNPGQPLIYLSGGSFYSDINITESTPTSNSPGTIEVANSGSLGNCVGGNAINSSGASLPGCVGGTQAGFQFVGPGTYSNNPPVYFSSWYPPFNFSGSPIQMARAGESNTSLEIDPLMGDMFGPGGTVGGYDLSLARSAAQTLGLSVARALPPTVITATPSGSGGTLAAGTYTYGVASAVVTSNCNTITNYYLTASATTTGSTSSVLVGWTDPTNTANITGYCVLRNPNETAATQAFFVSGSTATSYTDIGSGGSLISGPVINNTFPASPNYTFSPTTFTAPAISAATITGTASVTSPSIIGSGLTNGNCVQAGSGGLLTTVSGPCSTGGTVTSVGLAMPSWLTVTGTPVTTTGTLTAAPTTAQTSHEVIGTCGSATTFTPCALVAGDLPAVPLTTGVSGILPVANGGTGTASPALVAGTNVTITGSWPDQTINASGGGGSVGPGTTNGLAYFNASTTVTSPTPPSTNGQYSCGYTITGSATAPPTCPLIGFIPGQIAGGSTSYVTSYADNSSGIVHLETATASATLTLSTPTTVLNASPIYSYSNHSTHTDTIAPAGGFTIQSGSSAAASTLSVATGVECRIYIDPSNPTTNWLADCRPNGGSPSVAFSTITPGTNTGALVIGTNGSLTTSGTGTINANILNSVTLSGSASSGNCIVATSSSAADWGSCATLAFPATVTGGTTGHFTAFGSATSLGVNANTTDISNLFTYSASGGILASTGPIEAGVSGGGVGEPFIFQEGTQPSSAASQIWCYGNSSTNSLWCNSGNTAYAQVAFSPSSSTAGDLPTFSDTTGKTFQDSPTAAATAVNAAIQSLSGCNTATYVYTPQASDCVAPSGGGGANVNVLSLYQPSGSAAAGLSTAGDTNAMGIVQPYNGVYGHIYVNVNTADNTSNTYNVGIYNSSGTLLCSTGAVAGSTLFPSTGNKSLAFTSNCTLSQGSIYFVAFSAITSNTAKLYVTASGSGVASYQYAQVSTSAMPSTITPPSLTYGPASTANLWWQLIP
jgi:hypothetical protein